MTHVFDGHQNRSDHAPLIASLFHRCYRDPTHKTEAYADSIKLKGPSLFFSASKYGIWEGATGSFEISVGISKDPVRYSMRQEAVRRRTRPLTMAARRSEEKYNGGPSFNRRHRIHVIPAHSQRQRKSCRERPTLLSRTLMKFNSPIPQSLPKECAKAAKICACPRMRSNPVLIDPLARSPVVRGQRE